MAPTLPRAAPVALGPTLLPAAVKQATRCHKQALSSISDRSARSFTGAEAPAGIRQELAAARLPVIDCISACVEADAAVERFETVAGRSAMIGFAVALVCEGILPRAGQQGFFGQDSPQTLWTLAGCAAAVICTAVALATVSKVTKRRAGEPLSDAVFASLTSLSARGISSGQQRINTAVDRVFEEVLSQPFVRRNLVDIDDFI